MTSNIWQEEFANKAEQIWFDISEWEEEKVMKDYEKAKENIMSNLTDYFSPEFINRIDKIVVFNPLDKKDIRKIVKIWLEDFEKRLDEKWIKIEYDTKILNKITKDVYNPEFWAREIRRYITDKIEDEIAEKMIWSWNKKEFKITVEKNNLTIR